MEKVCTYKKTGKTKITIDHATEAERDAYYDNLYKEFVGVAKNSPRDVLIEAGAREFTIKVKAKTNPMAFGM